MEYNPRYPQPFTLTQAIALDPAVAWDEIARLTNSLLHLKQSQSDLQQYLQDLTSEEGVDIEVSQALKENEITMHVYFNLLRRLLKAQPLGLFRASQDERVFMLKLALTHHGYSVASEQTSETLTTPPEHSQVAFGCSSNGLDELTSGANSETAEVEERENGVYL